MQRHKIKKRGYNARQHISHHDFKKRFKKKKSILKSRVFWYLVLACVVFLVLVYLLFFSSVFRIKDIKVSADGLSPDNVQEIALLVEAQVKGKNYFFINQNRIKSQLLTIYPDIKELSFKKILPNGLAIALENRQAMAVYCFGENSQSGCFLVDEQGISFKEIADSQLAGEMALPLIFSQDESAKNLLEQAISTSTLAQILLIEKTQKSEMNVQTENFLLKSNGKLAVKTKEQWEIYFALDSDIKLALGKLKLFLEREITLEARKNLEYIDLRFSKVYYK